jgi:hypothetical protein
MEMDPMINNIPKIESQSVTGLYNQTQTPVGGPISSLPNPILRNPDILPKSSTVEPHLYDTTRPDPTIPSLGPFTGTLPDPSQKIIGMTKFNPLDSSRFDNLPDKSSPKIELPTDIMIGTCSTTGNSSSCLTRDGTPVKTYHPINPTNNPSPFFKMPTMISNMRQTNVPDISNKKNTQFSFKTFSNPLNMTNVMRKKHVKSNSPRLKLKVKPNKIKIKSDESEKIKLNNMFVMPNINLNSISNLNLKSSEKMVVNNMIAMPKINMDIFTKSKKSKKNK